MNNKTLGGLLAVALVFAGYIAFKDIKNISVDQNQSAVGKSIINKEVVQTNSPEQIERIRLAGELNKLTESNQLSVGNNATTSQEAINYVFSKTLKPNTKSEEVKMLQMVLAENVSYEGKITSVMDKETVTALKEFQEDNGLEATGTTGPKTREMLTKLSASVGPCSHGQQAIKVKKPNGNEVFQSAQSVKVKWRTCNISHSTNINIILAHYPTGSPTIDLAQALTYTPNDGTENVTLPVIPSQNYFTAGRNYKILARVGQGPFPGTVFDFSDNLFTINGSVVSCPSGGSQPSITVVSPNGGETYGLGDTIPFNWVACNQGPSGTFGISLWDTASANAYLGVIIPISANSHNWTVPANVAPGQYKARIFCNLPNSDAYCRGSSLLSEDLSDNFFSINTPVVAPTSVITGVTGNITDISANINGSGSSNDPTLNGTSAFFRYGVTTGLGSNSSVVYSSATNLTTAYVQRPISGLLPNTIYYYKFCMQNMSGTTCGATRNFVTNANNLITVISPSALPVSWSAGVYTVDWQPTSAAVVGITFCFNAPTYQCSNSPFAGGAVFAAGNGGSAQVTVINPYPGNEQTVIGKIRVFDRNNPANFDESDSDVTIVSSNFPG